MREVLFCFTRSGHSSKEPARHPFDSHVRPPLRCSPRTITGLRLCAFLRAATAPPGPHTLCCELRWMYPAPVRRQQCPSPGLPRKDPQRVSGSALFLPDRRRWIQLPHRSTPSLLRGQRFTEGRHSHRKQSRFSITIRHASSLCGMSCFHIVKAPGEYASTIFLSDFSSARCPPRPEPTHSRRTRPAATRAERSRLSPEYR